MINIRKLESELWESADLLRAGFKLVEAEILKDRPMRGGRVMPVEATHCGAAKIRSVYFWHEDGEHLESQKFLP